MIVLLEPYSTLKVEISYPFEAALVLVSVALYH
jgi:hypothetical protein